MGASAASVWYNLNVRHPCREVPIIDYDLALLFQPMLMLGITFGVSLSVVFPYWLITILIIVLFLGKCLFYHKEEEIYTSYYSNQLITGSVDVYLVYCASDHQLIVWSVLDQF